MFSGCPSVRPCVRASVRPCVRASVRPYVRASALSCEQDYLSTTGGILMILEPRMVHKARIN